MVNKLNSIELNCITQNICPRIYHCPFHPHHQFKTGQFFHFIIHSASVSGQMKPKTVQNSLHKLKGKNNMYQNYPCIQYILKPCTLPMYPALCLPLVLRPTSHRALMSLSRNPHSLFRTITPSCRIRNLTDGQSPSPRSSG